MKRKMSLLLITSCLLTACASGDYEPVKNPNWEESQSIQSEVNVDELNIDSKESEIKTEGSFLEDLNYDVEVVLAAYIFDNSGIDKYVEQLKNDNPNGKYSVYNDEYYISTITEAERLEYLKGIKEGNALDEAFSQLLNDEQYGGAFIDIKYDENLQNFKLYVDRSLYEQNIFVCSIGSSLIINAISDSYQAYSLINPEERIINIIFIDNETGNVIE